MAKMRLMDDIHMERMPDIDTFCALPCIENGALTLCTGRWMSSSIRSEVVCYRGSGRSLRFSVVWLSERRGGMALDIALSRHRVGR